MRGVMAADVGRKTIYLAGPLFTVAQREANSRLAELLQTYLPHLDIVLPQERAKLFLPDLKAVAEDCFGQVEIADAILACLDGADADSGTCIEIGYARALGKWVLGYRTDVRGSEIDGVNAMVRYGCSDFLLAPSTQFSLDELAQILVSRLAQHV
jgi:nucleoside 2-deoxyribosyltransferase